MQVKVFRKTSQSDRHVAEVNVNNISRGKLFGS